MIREVFVVVTASGGWSQSHGIDMLASAAFNNQPVGYAMDGWTVAARCSTRATADSVRQDARDRGLDSIILVFFADGAVNA